LGELTNAVVIPAQAVQSSQAGEFVFVVKPDQTVEKRSVKLGSTRNNASVITDGLQAGETVVTDGQMRLVPGAKVRTQTSKPEPTAPTVEQKSL
jgi:multidrug efflux system membrane fusion protein